MPVYFLPSTREEDELAAFLMRDKKEPCWLCKRESRKTTYGYMCWECQEKRPIWEAHLTTIVRAEYERKARAYRGLCQTCAGRQAESDFECGPCRQEWEI